MNTILVLLVVLWAGVGWAGGGGSGGFSPSATCVEIGPGETKGHPCTARERFDKGDGLISLPICVDVWGNTVPCTTAEHNTIKTIKAEHRTVECFDQMEAAMRAMDHYIPPFVDPVERRRNKNSPIMFDDLLCRNCYSGDPFIDTRSIEERLADDRRKYEREQEERGRQIAQDAQERWAYQQWTEAKACWRKP